MIPKIIHYCWFGKGEMTSLEKRCMASWEKYCPDFQIKLWNEENFDINFCEFTKEAYRLGKYAFVSDVARFYALQQDGGVYLDTDMLLVNEINDFLFDDFFLGYENERTFNGAIIGSQMGNYHVVNLLELYKNLTFLNSSKISIPKLLRSYFEKKKDFKCYPQNVFYPLPFEKRKENPINFITQDSVSVHLWNHSWRDKYSCLIEGDLSGSLKEYFRELMKFGLRTSLNPENIDYLKKILNVFKIKISKTTK